MLDTNTELNPLAEEGTTSELKKYSQNEDLKLSNAAELPQHLVRLTRLTHHMSSKQGLFLNLYNCG